MRLLSIVVAAIVALAGIGAMQIVGAQGQCGETYTVQAGDTLSRIAARCGTTVAAILEANPGIADPNRIFPGQVLRMPAGGGPPEAATYIVQPGDTLTLIAARFSTTVQAILEANPGIINPNQIIVGQALTIPVGTQPPPTSTPTPQPMTSTPTPTPAAGQVTYVVQSGDTLIGIARRFNVGLAALLAVNPGIVNPNLIFPGQRLVIPTGAQAPPTPTPTSQPMTPTPTPTPAAGQVTYVVQSGDTLIGIARRFNVSLAELLAANPGISNPNIIVPGQRIVVPGAGTGPRVSISPTSGPPGTTVQGSATGFPANSMVGIGVGRVASEYDVVREATTDAEGNLSFTVEIPSFADPDERWVVAVVLDETPSVRAISNEFRVTEAGTEAPTFTRVLIYLIALEQGDVGCNDAVVPVAVNIEPTTAPLTAAIRELLALRDRTFGGTDLYNALHNSDLEIESIDLQNGLATIRLAGDLVLGGVCDNPRVEAQLEQTALQFDTVDQVEIFINDTPLESLLSERGM